VRKIHKFKNSKPVFVVEKGIKYQVMDLGGHKMKVRVKSDEEKKRDSELFQSYKKSKKVKKST
tara:strand:- start:234 stop:422 length:189 start_codon:yes stop_codon:yes gene_type:complete